ncbi:AAA family ATPase [Paraburkholderia terrae]|uniref:AAA family ATPase n=1 Tax=Paraburkholderia terrae TaxID=311230 RepID=UPI00296AB08F|nr:AAA family ATPase [Paraburkholderia terrae]MDW3657818.1 AAA family ATPase [Paraburkholderia terrae]
MRFQRLELIKYGKFSGQTLELPKAERDFHLIVGPNEAGKSTLRAAILDLLFGIPARSPHGFRHPLNELRLGTCIANETSTLEFHRMKAQKQTLRSPLDAVLPDTTLTAYLGEVTREFFDQMFGLDHTRLMEGGKSILNAESDIGQILFQSAAGIAGLGKTRDALTAEAETLWGPRRAGDRAYYVALDQLEKATAALKEASVRTKVWSEVNGAVQDLDDSLREERRRQQVLKNQRDRLERVRRLAPLLATVRQNEAQLAQLVNAVELPADATSVLASAERDLAIAGQRLTLRQQDIDKATQELEQITLDDAILENATDINALDERRLQYAAYERDIDRREQEVAVLWQRVRENCNDLGWKSDDEKDVRARMPTLLVRRRLTKLARDHSGIERAFKAAEQARQAKEMEIEELSAQLDGLQTAEVKAGLRAALAGARALGDTDAVLRAQKASVTKAQAALDRALQTLGNWRMPMEQLQTLQLPSQQALALRLRERQTLVADQKSCHSRLDEQKSAVAKAQLLARQYVETHHPTTYETVVAARQSRDTSWNAIKAGRATLSDGANEFETAMRHADDLADEHRDDVGEATELQNHQHQLELENHKLLEVQRQVAEIAETLGQFDAQWSEECERLYIAGMPLEELGEWMTKREAALSCAQVQQEAFDTKTSLCEATSKCTSSLIAALRDSGLDAESGESLPTLCMKADEFISAVDGSKVRLDTLSDQRRTAEALLAKLKKDADDTKADLEQWGAGWTEALATAGIGTASDVGSAEGALELVVSIEDNLEKMRQIRVERIETMNSDLRQFAADVETLASKLAPHVRGQDAATTTRVLARQLRAAMEARTEADRLREALRVANLQAEEAREAIQTANALLSPLMEEAHAESRDALSQAVRKSDEKRSLLTELTAAERRLLEDGDGLTRQTLEAEIDSTDLDRLTAQISQTDDELAEAVDRQTATSAALATARAALYAIGGTDTAALAEARRQEAIAQMSDAAERYIRIFTASRLLRWSIDRYREEKQGPMLARASTIFASLTLGSFQKLVVDFERQPMALEGQRPDGRTVGISGMSDGTRDQLFLALRLAALELHLEQSTALPFVADDLFINYDDARSKAGLEALAELSAKTQVIFLSHHDHLVPLIHEVFGKDANVMYL